MRAYNRDGTLRPLASRDLRCDREIIIDGRTLGRDSLLINNFRVACDCNLNET